MAETLDFFYGGVITQDTKKRVETGEELVSYLQNEKSSLHCEEMGKFVDGLSIWVNSSSFKVSLFGLEVILLLITRLKNNFKPYVTSVMEEDKLMAVSLQAKLMESIDSGFLSAVIDRLGDNKDQVRETARDVLLNLMNPGSTPQYVAERLTPGFTHKLWKVREEILICLQNALNNWGSKNFVLSKLVPLIVKLLEDPSGPVRDQAVVTLVEFYKHVGDKIRNDLVKRDINQTKLSMIFAKMDDVKNRGLMIATEVDELDAFQKSQLAMTKKSRSVSSGRCQPLLSRPPQGGNHDKGLAAGALDEDGFVKSFHDAPKILISSGRDISDRLSKIKDMLADVNKDWERRQDALKELRSIMIHGGSSYPEFQQGLKACSPSLKISVQDLRSQIVREACVTLAFLSQEMGRDFEGVAEIVIPAIVQLLQNSAKVMSSSGFICLKFIVQNTHSHRLIPHLTNNLTSKSTIIRRQCCEIMEQMLRVWPVSVLERQLPSIQEAIKRGLSDADPEARVHSRRAYWNFEEHFKHQASSIFSSLDSAQQKHLTAAQGCSGSSSSSSTSSINIHPNSTLISRTLPNKSKIRSISGDRSKQHSGASKLPQSTSRQGQNLQKSRSRTGSEASDIPRSSSTASLTSSNSSSKMARPMSGNGPNFHSLPTTPTNTPTNQTLGHSQSSSDLSTPPKKPHVSKPLRRNASMRLPRSSAPRTSNGEARHRKSPNPNSQGGDTPLNRPSKFGSTSQPSSRSVSPSSRYSYMYQQQPNSALSFQNDLSINPQTSQRYIKGALRETSPSRADMTDAKRRKSAAPMRVPLGSTTAANWSVASELDGCTKNLLRRSVKPRRVDGNNLEAGSEEMSSETSSLCSDNSGKSFNAEDMLQVIEGLRSGSWTDRRDSLLYMQNFFQNHKFLSVLNDCFDDSSRQELGLLTQSFDRLFFEKNPKVTSVFLDTLVHLISSHRTELGDWMSLCLPELLNKMGCETQPVFQTKIQKALDNIRVFFPAKMQFQILTKFMVDQMKNATIGVKLAVLGYLQQLTIMMNSDDLINASDVKLAITRVITCSTEPKSPEVRKVSTVVFVRLHQLNPELFCSMLEALPKSFQESGNRILQNNCTFNHDEEGEASFSPVFIPSSSPNVFEERQRSSASKLPVRLNTSDSENINPYSNNSTTSLSSSSSSEKRSLNSSSPMVQLHGNRPSNNFGASDPRVTSSAKRIEVVGAMEDEETMINGSLDRTIGRSLIAFDKDIFSEAFSFNHADMTTDEHADDDDDDEEYMDCPKPDEIDMIIQELAYRNEREEEREYRLAHLFSIANNKESTVVWDHHSKTILMLLLDILKNDAEIIREMALKVIVELVYNHLSYFTNHEELILSSVIEARKDSSQKVASVAQESALIIALLFPVQLSISIILPFITGQDPLTRLLAFRIQLKIIERITDVEQMKDLMPTVMPGILKGYEDSMSAIRKDSVFTLVKIYLVIGDELKPYLKDMSNNKLKLLNLYIKRALTPREQTTA